MIDLSSFSFTVEPFEGCEILCPECKGFSIVNEWKLTDVYCELCGEHEAIKCPKCSENFDHVYAPVFEIKQPTQ